MLTEGENRLLHVEADEDSDMKIAGGKPLQRADDGEVAAKEFSVQKENGNVERAYVLGVQLAELLFTTDELLEKVAPQYASKPTIQINARILFAFMAGILLENCCPTSVTARTALNEFYKRVAERSQEDYQSIIDSPAFSLYLLCARDETMACSCIGHAFADGCDMENDPAVSRLGDELYSLFYDKCAKEIGKIDFVR